MCLILFAWQSHPRYPLVVAANRDEFHQRPSAAADFWGDDPGILAGRDLQAGGTWLGVTRSGRFAAVTNYREPSTPEIALGRSRGHLVSEFLGAESEPLLHADKLYTQGSSYRGFNLLLGSRDALAWVSNRDGKPLAVGPGSHGLSNHLLDTDWPKVHSGKERLEKLLAAGDPDPEALFDLLTDQALTPGEIPQDLETTLAPERLAKHYFIVSPVYGTRCSTVVLITADGQITFIERQFDPAGKETGTRRFDL